MRCGDSLGSTAAVLLIPVGPHAVLIVSTCRLLDPIVKILPVWRMAVWPYAFLLHVRAVRHDAMTRTAVAVEGWYAYSTWWGFTQFFFAQCGTGNPFIFSVQCNGQIVDLNFTLFPNKEGSGLGLGAGLGLS